MSDDQASSPALPQSGRLAGVDYGTVRIGIALCDPSQIIASPHEIYAVLGGNEDAEYFRRLVVEESVVGFVVGLPIHLSGDESEKSLEAREFAKWLGQTTGLPVELLDERFTTNFAEQLLAERGMTRKQKKKRVDAFAAQLLLSQFIDSRR